MSKRINQIYPNEFITESVNLALSGEKSVACVATSLGMPSSTLHGWIKKYQKDKTTFSKPNKKTAQELEIIKLKKQLATVEMERDILKKAVAIFSKTK